VSIEQITSRIQRSGPTRIQTVPGNRVYVSRPTPRWHRPVCIVGGKLILRSTQFEERQRWFEPPALTLFPSTSLPPAIENVSAATLLPLARVNERSTWESSSGGYPQKAKLSGFAVVEKTRAVSNAEETRPRDLARTVSEAQGHKPSRVGIVRVSVHDTTFGDKSGEMS
jgi:hypothetical protein